MCLMPYSDWLNHALSYATVKADSNKKLSTRSSLKQPGHAFRFYIEIN